MFRIKVNEFFFVQTNESDHRKSEVLHEATKYNTIEEAEAVVQRQSLETIFDNVIIEKIKED